ncbi:flippase-like domain-containing protein [Baekduia soli]|uniref:Flippase-like domain-containing protein n=1 Tax=Baekduia soli TaxID=496014 RepID=A0A5B8U8B6_9ACTN|nr:flippase-like domain-containing protein [Baekduia soli]QEC49314.1 flippase-like domain-containing protein [Baekduia soli]
MRPSSPTAATEPPERPSEGLPGEFDLRRLAVRTAEVVVALGVFVAIALLAPGLGEVRDLLSRASPGWLALTIVFEVFSALSYVLMFRPAFCSTMRWRSALEIGLSEVGTGSIIPASGAGGMALGAWVLTRAGMSPETIARRSVAFLLLKSSINFAAVVLGGVLVFAGVLGPAQPTWLTLGPAGLAALVIALVTLIPRLPEGRRAADHEPRARRLWSATRRALVQGTAEAGVLLHRRDPALWAGVIGYWAWDNLALWAAFRAVGVAPGVSVILLGYLIGQLGGLLPIPGGIGGIDGGLIGTLIVYGAAASPAAAAVLAYRIVLFWIPLILGAAAFIALRRSMTRPEGLVITAR